MARDDKDDAFEEDDRPRKKRSGEDDDAPRSSPKDALPGRVVAAAIASIGWGLVQLHASCLFSTETFRVPIMSLFRRNQMIDEFVIVGGPRGGQGVFWTLGAVNLICFIASAVLVAGGVMLLMRKGFAKFLVMGAPVLVILLGLIGVGVSLIFTSGHYLGFLTRYFDGLLFHALLSLIVGVLNCVMLLNKDVSKALR